MWHKTALIMVPTLATTKLIIHETMDVDADGKIDHSVIFAEDIAAGSVSAINLQLQVYS